MINQLINKNELPQFQNIKIEAVLPQLKAQLETNRSTLKDILAASEPQSWDTLMQPLEDMGDQLNKLWSPISHLHAVKESEPLREVYNTGLQLITEYHTELSQSEPLYQAIKQFSESDLFLQLNAAQQKIIENDLRDFKLAGIHLSTEQKAKLALLQLELSKLMNTFSEHILDATHGFILPIKDEAQLEGLPQQTLELAKEHAKNSGQDGYVITLDYPMYSSAMKFLAHRELRQTLYTAYVTRASDQGPQAGQWDNTEMMNKLLNIRHEIANLVGFNNYADYSLATKMAKTPEEVLSFLQDLLTRSMPIAKEEFATVSALAKKDGVSDLQAWDIAFYSEQLRQSKYAFSPEDLRPYFPINAVLDGMFTIVNKLYGINIQEQKDVPTWHKDVRFFTIADETKTLRAGFYTDLYARAHKRDGAWMDDCQSRRTFSDGSIQLPIAYLTCNFMPPVNHQPALLTHDDVVTLFHEFGHCLHHMLTKVDYTSVSGINGVPWDAVEFPSQFMENFCWEKASLDLIAKHYQTGAPLPDELFKKMLAAKHFQTGMQMIRQLEFALFDFKLHFNYDPKIPNFVQQTLDQVRAESCVVPVPSFNRFQNSFSHIFAGGYAAGYYSYKWAEVLSADAYSAFEDSGLFNQRTGHSFLENILEVGGVRDPMLSFIAFRGRKPTIEALLKQSGMATSAT